MDELIRLIKKTTMRVMLYPMRLLPIKKNRVVLFNNLSNTYSCNPKYIAEYLRKEYNGKFDLVYIVKDPKRYRMIKGIHFIRLNSLPYFYNVMTTKVFVTNSGGHSYFPLKNSQYVINTWHGGGAYKKAGLDMYKNAKGFRYDLKLSAAHTNVFLSTNKRFTQEISRAMVVPRGCFWEIGMPRNDMLINGASKKAVAIRSKLGLKEDEKLVLYAPTYRKTNDNYFKDSIAISYDIDPQMVCEALSTRFGGKWVFAIRLHPCVTNREDYQMEGILDLTDYEDMQELLLAADVMINDFSSSMWDFMLTKKPCFTYAKDLQHYIATTEVYTDVADWPFPQSTSNDELVKSILSFNESDYKRRCRQHYKELGGCESGKATELVAKKIAKVCKITL
jgi:CDP-glycerol glycerophosphotransferase